MERLKEDLKNFSGNVLCVGLKDKKMLNILMKNNTINLYSIDRNPAKGLFSRSKKAKMNGSQKINMKKMRKKFKKKSVDYIVCNINEIYDYFKYFLYDSVYINRKKLYLYGESKYIDPNVLAKRFQRYHAKTFVETMGQEFLIIVDNEKSRCSFLKAKWYVIVDSFHNMGDMISQALIS